MQVLYQLVFLIVLFLFIAVNNFDKNPILFAPLAKTVWPTTIYLIIYTIKFILILLILRVSQCHL